LGGYELTGLGKLLVTVIAVVLVFLLPVTLFLVFGLPSQLLDFQGTSPSPTTVMDGTPQNGDSYDPPDTSPPPYYDESTGYDESANGNEQATDTDIYPPVESEYNGYEPLDEPSYEPDIQQPYELRPPSFDPHEGTLSFFFAPDLQDVLDPATLSALDEFLRLVDYADDSIIVIEIPPLSPGEAESFITAISLPMSERGIDSDRVSFVIHAHERENGAFVVNMYHNSPPTTMSADSPLPPSLPPPEAPSPPPSPPPEAPQTSPQEAPAAPPATPQSLK